MWSFTNGSVIGCIQRYLNYYALFLGNTSYLYCEKENTFRTTVLIKWTSIGLNIFIICTLPLFLLDSLNLLENSEHTLVMWYCIVILTLVRGINIFYSVAYRYHRDQQLYLLNMRLLQLDDIFFTQLNVNPHIEQHVNKMFYMRTLPSLYSLCNMSVGVVMSYRIWTWRIVLLTFLFVNALNILHLVGHEHFLLLWRVYRRLLYVNKEIETMAAMQEKSILENDKLLKAAYQQLKCIQSIQAELVDIINKFNNTYNIQTLIQRLNVFAFNVCMGYFFISYTFTFNLGLHVIIFAMCSHVFLLYNTFLLDSLSFAISETTQQARELMPQFSYFTSTNYKEFIRLCDLFMLRLSILPINAEIFGMVMNKSLWFRSTASIVSYIIVLWQFHLVEIYKNQK